MIAIAVLIVSLTPVATKIPAAIAGSADSSGSSLTFQQLSRAAGEARERNRDEAIPLYQRALTVKPEWPEGLWYLSTLLYEKERYADSRDLLRRFIALQPSAGPGWALLGMSEFQTRQYSRALEHLQRAMALGMGDRKQMIQSVFFSVAALLTRLERYDDSMNMLVRMIAQDQDPASLVEPAGLAGLRMPLLPVEIPADRGELIHMAGEAVVALQTQRYDDADVAFKKLEAAYPNEPGVHFLYGAYLMPLHPEDGIREMKRELEISPFHVLATIRLAEQYLHQQNIEQALPLAHEAVKLEPQRASSHMLLGEAYVASGNLADGIKELERARNSDPMASRIHWDLLRAYTAAERSGDAKHEKDEIEKLSQPASESGPDQDKKSIEQAPSR
jgi:tetratricopeptide (TPR) repeat protein